MLKDKGLLVHTLLVIGAFLTTFPFIWMVLTSLKDDTQVLDTTRWMPVTKTYVMEQGSDPPRRTEVEVLGDENGFKLVKFLEGSRRNETDRVKPEAVILKRWHWENYKTAWNRGGDSGGASFGRYFLNSFFVASLTTIGIVFTSILAGFGFAFFEFPGKAVLFSLLMVTMMVPQQVLLIPDYLLINRLGWLDSFPALVVPWCAGVFGIFLLRQFFLTFPRDLYEAAILDGCTRMGFMFRILMPLSLPPILTLSIFSFLSSWNSLIWPLVVASKAEYFTIQVGLASFATEAGTRWELLMAASAISILPLVALYFMAQRYFVEGIAQTGIKG